MNHLHEAAHAAHTAGLCVIPAATTGTKQPYPDSPSWKSYQTRQSTPDQLDTWFGGGRYDGMGLVTGTISGHLELLEFEGRAVDERVSHEMAELARDSGLGDLWARVATGYVEQTPSGGLHLLYRVDGPVAGNTKLASRPATPAELAESPKEKVKVLIETRGEGGFVVVAPSAGRTHPTRRAWELVTGSFATIPTLTPAERDALHHLAGALDQMPPPEQPAAFTQPPRLSDDGVRPGDDFNERATWLDILGPLGWIVVRTIGGVTYWRRPGKSIGISATTGRGGMDNLYVFSTSTEFEAERPYDKFGAYTLLTHGSTSSAALKAATKDLAAQGYGRRADRAGRDDFSGLIAPAVDGNLATVHQLHPAPAAGGGQHRGHLRMAERFVAEHAEQLRHVHGLGWHRWDGARWAADDQRADIVAAVATTKAALREAVDLPKEERDDLLKDVRKSENSSGVEGMLKLAGALPPISTAASALDANPYLFNTPAGTLDLQAGAVRPNDRADLITKVAGAAPVHQGDSEWTTFLARVLPDADVRAFVQRVFGYAMLGKVTEHVMLIFTGTGANGKGTTRDALMAAFGDYAIEIDPAMLMESKHERHGAFKMRLRGARLVFCSETEKGRRFAEATMKRLVGGDPIEANLMHKNPITFLPSHTLIMLTNHLPTVSGDDPAVWRRILVVPFDVVIPEHEQDGDLPDRLKAAAPAVLAWAHQGWLDYQRQGLNPPEAVRRRTDEYQANSDVLGRFLEERTIANPHGHVKARDLFGAWNQWCYDSGETPTPEKGFAESMAQRGFEKKRSAAGMAYKGFVLAAPDDN